MEKTLSPRSQHIMLELNSLIGEVLLENESLRRENFLLTQTKKKEELAERYKIPVSTLGLSSRAYNCLRRGNIKYVEQLAELTDNDLLRLRNMGVKTLAEVKSKL